MRSTFHQPQRHVYKNAVAKAVSRKDRALRTTPKGDARIGRSPGSRVTALKAAFPMHLCISGIMAKALTAHSCGGSRGFGQCLSAPHSLFVAVSSEPMVERLVTPHCCTTQESKRALPEEG